MGQCHSQGQEAEIVSPLEARLIRAVVAAKARQEPHHKQSFNTLLMAFPKMRPGFLKVNELFKAAAHGGSRLELCDVKQQCQQLGIANPDNLTLVLTSGVVGKQFLEAQDLILVYTVLYLTDSQARDQLTVFPEIIDTLNIIERAFTFFDSSSDGYLEKDEITRVLMQGTKAYDRGRGGQHQGIGEMLFSRLDVDGSGKVSFKEFLLGMQHLCCSDLDEEVEEVQEMEAFLAASRRSVTTDAAPGDAASQSVH